MSYELAFALGFLRNPRRMGAVVPASQALARTILNEVMRVENRVLIEVGAGTGSITRALAKSLQTLERFVVFERDPGFAKLLHDTCPGVEVLNHCASKVDSLVIEPLTPITLVSSLPLLSMPEDEARQCIDAMLALLMRQPDSRLIQYTYASRQLRPFKDLPPGWRWRRVASVWANLPPATVWALERAPLCSTRVH